MERCLKSENSVVTMEATITRKSTNSECNFSLPDDVVYHILSWLPVISLLRFKSVCKSWLAVIENTAFIRKHLHHHHHYPSLRDNNYNLLVGFPLRDHNLYLLSGSEFEVPVKLELDAPCFREFHINVIEMATCDGIICLNISDAHYLKKRMNAALWNPAIQQLRALPLSPYPYPSASVGDYPRLSLGFGFDVKTDDYKVVRIFTYYRGEGQSRVEAYSLNTDSWKAIHAVLPAEVMILSNPRIPYQRGKYCWLGRNALPPTSRDKRIFDDFILSFDFSEEKFGTMSLPVLNKYGGIPQIAIVEDKIRYISGIGGDFEVHQYEIWVLHEYGVQESWCKLCKVGPFSCVKELTLSKKGDYLFLWKTDNEIWLYNLTHDIMKLLPVGRVSPPNKVQLALYKESLVSVRVRIH